MPAKASTKTTNTAIKSISPKKGEIKKKCEKKQNVKRMKAKTKSTAPEKIMRKTISIQRTWSTKNMILTTEEEITPIKCEGMRRKVMAKDTAEVDQPPDIRSEKRQEGVKKEKTKSERNTTSLRKVRAGATPKYQRKR